MPVSFYSLAFITVLALLVIVTPFLALPHALESAAVAILGTLILGTAIHAFYRGYVRIIRLQERRASRRSASIDDSGAEKGDTEPTRFEEQDSTQLPQRTQSKINIVRDE
jgi:hypothetical protein